MHKGFAKIDRGFGGSGGSARVPVIGGVVQVEGAGPWTTQDVECAKDSKALVPCVSFAHSVDVAIPTLSPQREHHPAFWIALTAAGDDFMIDQQHNLYGDTASSQKRSTWPNI